MFIVFIVKFKKLIQKITESCKQLTKENAPNCRAIDHDTKRECQRRKCRCISQMKTLISV